ncbi:hypothetical protein [uncultured Roseibium sp.]|uniref:hypothetical protein n=1 Tax=uncultured Roseibium sp. TaxID=1936171 RepID=UPI0025976D0B|nr:hypothetical protein [uncultured Roseibium sp.]
MGRAMDGVLSFITDHFFDGASLLLAAGALIYAALALRVAKQALVTAKMSDVATLKLKAHEGRERAEKSFLSLQSACHDTRSQWNLHHDHHYPTLGSQDFRQDDTRHISEIENEGRTLLGPLELGLSELGTMDVAALEDYIQMAHRTAARIEQLRFRLSPPKQLFA